MELSERELQIIKGALFDYRKKIKRAASAERKVFGTGHAMDELEDFLLELCVRVEKALAQPHMVEAYNERMERVNAR